MWNKIWGRAGMQGTRAALFHTFNCFALLGTYPPENCGNWYRIYALFTFTLCSIITPAIFNLSFLSYHEMSVSQLLTSVQASINIWGMPVKFITLFLSLQRLKGTEQYMKILDARCKHANDHAQIRTLSVMCKRIVMSYSCIYTTYVSSTFVSSIAFGHPPFALYMPFWDWRNSPLEFWLQVLYEAIVMYYVVLCQLATDSYGAVYIRVIRTHLQILAHRIRNLGSIEQSSADDQLEELVKCIIDHKHILSLMETIGPVMSKTLFLQYLIISSMLGITLIHILIFADMAEIIASVFYLMTVLTQTFPTSYQATSLISDCEDLPLAIFQCNWLDKDIRFRKMLIFFMQRSQKSMALMAMKLFPIDLRTNINIAKFSFSLLTLIENMDFGKNWKD